MARRFLSLMGTVLRHIDVPDTEFHDWVDRADRSLKDLARSPKATIRHYGHRYVHPYTAAEYPDSMVQLTVLASIRDYEIWSGTKAPIGAELAAGLGKFYDPGLKTIRRYLPNVGKDKDKHAVDSWYLYHPLLDARPSRDRRRRSSAKRLFEDRSTIAIKAARHFNYSWPIQFKVDSFEVIVEARNDDGLGQTDVGGIYAYVMLQAFELTDDKRFLRRGARGDRCCQGHAVRAQLSGQPYCLGRGSLHAAVADHRRRILSAAKLCLPGELLPQYRDLGVRDRRTRATTQLPRRHRAPRRAVHGDLRMLRQLRRVRALPQGQRTRPRPVRALAGQRILQLCAGSRLVLLSRCAARRCRLAEARIRNGHIDRKLSFPVEDLYVDGQQAGQVGQEIYGAGAAFVFASRSSTMSAARLSACSATISCSSERTSERVAELPARRWPKDARPAAACCGTGRAKLPSVRPLTHRWRRPQSGRCRRPLTDRIPHPRDMPRQSPPGEGTLGRNVAHRLTKESK